MKCGKLIHKSVILFFNKFIGLNQRETRTNIRNGGPTKQIKMNNRKRLSQVMSEAMQETVCTMMMIEILMGLRHERESAVTGPKDWQRRPNME